MNERIQELIKRATITKTELRNGWERKTYTYQEEVFDKEKFAELIVQRALEIVEAHTEIFQSDEAKAMVEHIKHSVKTDFGIEDAPVDNVDRILRTIRTRS
jgi:hypothetical protein